MRDFILKLISALFVFFIFFIGLNTYLNKNISEKNHTETQDNDTKIKDIKSKTDRIIYLTGRFDPAKNEDFILIPISYTTTQSKMYLRKEVLDAFLKMNEAAKKAGVSLKIASATRNFNYQKNIWENKWNGVTLVDGVDISKSIPDEEARFKKILEYSAAPGTSRHHWGTDIDINGVTPGYFYTKAGRASYEWMLANAPRFGFCNPYNEKDSRINGYNEERWHWSYLPLAKQFTKDYKEIIKDKDISGFKGDKYLKNLDLINNYVLSINPDCL